MSWAFDIMPNTYTSAAILVRVLNQFYFIAFACIIFRICKLKFTASLFAMLCLVIVAVSGGQMDNIEKFPSATALRYLLQFSLPLSLSFLPKGKYFSIWTLFPVILASFWSVTALGACIAIYLFFFIAVGVYQKKALIVFKNFSILILTILAAHAIFIAYFKFTQGVNPNYLGYVQFVQSTDIFSTTSFIAVPIPPYYWIWGINVLLYFCIIVYILHRAFNAKPGDWEDRDWELVSRQLPLVAAGIFGMFYFLGRSFPSTWVTGALPFMAVLITGLDIIFSSKKISLAVNCTVKSLIFCAVAITSSFAIYRFSLPYSPHTGNSTILRKCLMPQGCSAVELFQTTKKKLNTPLYLQPGYHPSKLLMGIIKDSYEMVNLFYPESDRVLLLNTHPYHQFPYPTTVLLYAGKIQRLPISNSIEDRLSLRVKKLVFESLKDLKEGEILITLENGVLDLEQEIIGKIKENWNLCPMMRSNNTVIAYELSRASKCKLEHPIMLDKIITP